ncbi:hypothetical protein HHE02_00180, partial [Helicobacter heilmannii]
NQHTAQIAMEYYQYIGAKIKTCQSMTPALKKSGDKTQAKPLKPEQQPTQEGRENCSC